ncbi:MAG: Smr/MutS family protein [Holosporales bacterium]|jgi:DNA-nicking Smr family endonuclease|nr:Smr/MutS family protein [Holosporales bacterium]
MEEDHAFWLAVNKETKPLNKKRTVPTPHSITQSQEPSEKISTLKGAKLRIKAELAGSEYKAGVVKRLAEQKRNFGVEKLLLKKIKKVTIDGCLDLHGSTQTQAANSVHNFLYKNYFLQKTWVKIITGKSGILFHFVPILLEAECAVFVSGYAHASQNDGGSGALYVRIRRKTRST